MVRIDEKILQKNLMYNGDIILKYKIIYPQIRGFQNFNLCNYSKAIKLQNYAEKELFEEAKKTNDYNKQNGYPIMVYEVILNYTITYNNNDIVSLYFDEYIYSGGAHGNTTRTSQTWNLQDRRQIRLSDLFKRNPNYVSSILKNINEQIKNNIENGENVYFENYCCLTASNFRVENFYLVEGAIVIYYQQYDIAPYSSGILTFKIDFNLL